MLGVIKEKIRQMFIGPFQLSGKETSYLGWFIFTLLTCALSYPIFLVAALIKFRSEKGSYIKESLREALKSLGPMLAGVYFVGFFVVGLTVAIGSNILKVAGVPEEYFNLNMHPWFFYGLLLGVYGLWYLVCVIYVIRNMPWTR